MRFLIGIITGTLLTLFIATALDAPTRTTLDRSADTLSAAWHAVIEKTSDTLFPASGKTTAADVAALLARADVPATSKPGTETPAADEPEPTGSVADAAPSPPLRAAEPATPLAPPDELPPPPPVKVTVPVSAEALARIDPAAQPWPDTVADVPAEALAEEPAGGASGETADVWAPFHSQRSAQGFAARLSRTLDHEFRVERMGAGTYQVVFDVESPDERDALLTEIAEVTGQ